MENLSEIHRPRCINDVVWSVLKAKAAQKDQRSKQADWTREWSPNYNLLGEIGEWLYAELSGLQRRAGFGDGGEDFPGIDVKAVSYYTDPILKVEKIRTYYYALVAVDLENRLARYCGYADWELLDTAPLREFGHNTTTRALPESMLRRGLCPDPVPSAA